jgi:hypothetical protein
MSWAAFRRFDRDNPDIWRLFLRFTFQLLQAGRARYSARTILHRIRWETMVREQGNAGFKINDHWSTWYARKFHAWFPHYAGFFEVRFAKADLP